MRYPSLVLIVVTMILSILVILSPDSKSNDDILFAYGDSNLSYLEQVQANYDDYNNSLWRLGDNLQEGDYYSYKICNDNTLYQKIYPYHCYIISLEFVTILQSYKGDVWVVQGNFTILGTTPDITEQMIFLIDVDTFKVNTDILHKELGDSIQNTIFSLSIYDEKSLSIGTVWDQLDSYYTNKIPLEIKNKQTIQVQTKSLNGTIETSVLSYDIIIPSNIYLHNDFPFPIKAKLYSPNIIYPTPQELYYFELLEFGNYDSNYNSNYHFRDYKFNDSVSVMGDLGAE